MGTPNSRLMEMTMSAVGNSEFLTTSFITLELISYWGQKNNMIFVIKIDLKNIS